GDGRGSRRQPRPRGRRSRGRRSGRRRVGPAGSRGSRRGAWRPAGCREYARLGNASRRRDPVERLMRAIVGSRGRFALGALVVALSVLLALLAVRATRHEQGLGYVAWSAMGVAALVVPGVVAIAVALESLRRRGIDRSAVLLALAGLASFLPELGIAGSRPSLAFTAGLVLAWSMPPLVAQLALVYPDRRLGLEERVLAAAGYVATIGALGLLPALVFDPVDAG